MDIMILVFLGVLLAIGLPILLLVLLLTAYTRSRNIAPLLERMDRLERSVLRLARGQGISEEPAVEKPVLEEIQPAQLEPPRTQAPLPEAAARPVPSAAMADGMESWIGGRALGWIAVVLMLFAAVFFLKHAFDSNWIGPQGQVSIGLLLGAGLCLLGYRYHRHGWPGFSQMLSSAGIVVLYLCVYATFGFFHIVSQAWGSVFLIVVVVEAGLLAALYNAMPLALMAVIGGLITPLFLPSDHDLYLTFFLYLFVLDAAAVVLHLFRPWPVFTTLALVGTQALWGSWYQQYFHPEKLLAALGFQAALSGLFLGHILLEQRLRRRTSVEALLRLVLQAGLFMLAVYSILSWDYYDWLGVVAVLLSAFYAFLAWVVLAGQSPDRRLALMLTATAMGFLALVFPLQWHTTWIPLGWAAQGLALWWMGLRLNNRLLRGFALALLVLAASHLLLLDLPSLGYNEKLPVLNPRGLPALAVAACVLAAAELSRRVFRTAGPVDANRVIQVCLGLAGVLLVWAILSGEVYGYLASARYDADSWLRARLGLSALWAAYAVAVLAVGLKVQSKPLRVTALCLFGLTLAKVLFVDTHDLQGMYRVAVFVVLSILMLMGARGYQKWTAARRAAGEGTHAVA